MLKRLLFLLLSIPLVVLSVCVQLPYIAVKWLITGKGGLDSENPWLFEVMEKLFK